MLDPTRAAGIRPRATDGEGPAAARDGVAGTAGISEDNNPATIRHTWAML